MQQKQGGRSSLNAQQLQSIRSGQSARGAHPIQRKTAASRGAAKRRGTVRQNTTRRTQASRPARPARQNNNLLVIALLWLLPVSVPMMWGKRCTWPRPVKIGVSAALVVALATLMLLPGAHRGNTLGGVQLVSTKPEVEVYGPAIPATTMPAYTNAPGASIIANVEEDQVEYVYAAEGAECYHRYDCKFAYASSQRLTVYEAHFLGYRPCGLCTPPLYEG